MARGIRKVARRVKGAVKNSLCYYPYYHMPVDGALVFAESRNGRELAGNILRILMAIKAAYGSKYHMVVGVQRGSGGSARALLDAYGLNDVRVLRRSSSIYFWYLERAKYLLNDSTFPRRFVKREGQVYLNTWHGTPLKAMGRDSRSDRHALDNVQRNLLMSDYLLYPSPYCQDRMVDAFSLKGLYPGTVLHEGYPRNEVFFDETLRGKTRERYGLIDKRVYAYLPTYRDVCAGGERRQLEYVISSLAAVDEQLEDDEVLFVRLHYYAQGSLDLGAWDHVRPFPADRDPYELLAASDCLISDYSSVMFDFANSGAKVIRYVYDEEEYLAGRGMYELPEPFPFPEARTAGELCQELHRPKTYDDAPFRTAYCTYDAPGAASRLVRHVIGGEGCCEGERISSGVREKVLMYTGSLALNGITTSARALLANIDDGRDYWCAWVATAMRDHPERLDNLPKREGEVALTGMMYKTVAEAVAWQLYHRLGITARPVRRRIDRLFERNLRKDLPADRFAHHVQFSGYSDYATGLLQRTQGSVLFVHSDMEREQGTRHNLHMGALRDAYAAYGRVVVVSEDLRAPTLRISGGRARVRVVENPFDHEACEARSKMPLELQPGTRMVVAGDLKAFLGGHRPLICTVGRFSAEKNHAMLIEAFERFREGHPGAGLLIIGGDGPLYGETCAQVERSPAREAISLVNDIANPLPLVAAADLFVLASLYEGQGLVLLEADSVGVPVITTASPSNEAFLALIGAHTVQTSVEGLLAGMEAWGRGEVPERLEMDYEAYLTRCIERFTEVLS